MNAAQIIRKILKADLVFLTAPKPAKAKSVSYGENLLSHFAKKHISVK